MFADLNDPVLQPERIKAELIPEITISEGLRMKLDEMFSKEEKAYSKIRETTSVVQTDKSYVFFSNQWLYLAIMCKKYAQALFQYCDFFDNHMRTDVNVMNCIKAQDYNGSAYVSLFDSDRDREYMTKFINGDQEFRPGKNLVNAGDKIRSCKDIFGSCVLGKLDVPNASSAYLGNLVYYLAKRPTLYDELDHEISGQIEERSSAVKLPTVVKDCAKAIVDYIYKLDEFKGISERIEIMDQSIKINTGNTDGLLPEGNWLRYMFVRPSSGMYDPESSSDKTRVFDTEYIIKANGEEYRCKLTTEWVGTEITEGSQGNNYLQALIKIVGHYYSDVLEIKEEGGNYYIYVLKKEFLISDLPDTFDSDFTNRYITSLLTKPFVILTGNSGTGKTRIAKHFSQYLERVIDGNKNWLIVPVGADWTDNTKILGFYNPLEERYVSTPILDFILQAMKNPSLPYFLILDEMNLSHVERYFSDFLSAMESDEEIPLYKLSENKANSEEDNTVIPEKIRLPKNLFVTGTVNIDETTYMFSPKVLDRSNVVEFKPQKEDVLELILDGREAKNIVTAGVGIAEGFMDLANIIRTGICNVEKSKLELVKDFLNSLYDILQESKFEFAYRTVKEIRQYFAASFELQKKDFNITKIMDEQIAQKILPKIYGDKKQIGVLLDTIKEKCQVGIEDKSKDMTLSIEKIDEMKKRLDKYQYASFM
jgi:ATPase AAA family